MVIVNIYDRVNRLYKYRQSVSDLPTIKGKYKGVRLKVVLITQWWLFKHISQVDVLVSIPGFGTYIDVAVAVNVGDF